MEVTDNKYFWIYFLGTNFPNAFDEDSDTDLNDFIIDEYECDEDFINEFTQYSEDIFDTNDGYVDNPKIIEITLVRRLKILLIESKIKEYHF